MLKVMDTRHPARLAIDPDVKHRRLRFRVAVGGVIALVAGHAAKVAPARSAKMVFRAP